MKSYSMIINVSSSLEASPLLASWISLSSLMIGTTATPSLLRLLSHLMTLWVSHWSTPWLIHTTLLIHSSHSLVHTLVTSHVATVSSTSTHHLTLSSLISPCRVSTPISLLLLLLRPLLHHLRILLG